MRPTKRHLRAEVATAHVEVGQPACGVGPRFSATADRALVTCEHGACGGVRRGPREDDGQLVLALEVAPIEPIDRSPAPEQIAPVAPTSIVERLVLATERLLFGSGDDRLDAHDDATAAAKAVSEARAWLRENGGEVER
jgi:hypothetical protein